MRVRITMSRGDVVEGLVNDFDADTLKRQVEGVTGPGMPTWLSVALSRAEGNNRDALVNVAHIAVLEIG